jgi:hypothetical protein
MHQTNGHRRKQWLDNQQTHQQPRSSHIFHRRLVHLPLRQIRRYFCVYVEVAKDHAVAQRLSDLYVYLSCWDGRNAYHSPCNQPFSMEQIGSTICLHCGTRFRTHEELSSHERARACGIFGQATIHFIMLQLMDYCKRRNNAMPNPYSTPTTTSMPTPTQSLLSTPTPSVGPYQSLSEESRRNFESEMEMARQKYGAQMREAEQLPEPERSKRLASLKNSFNTKQSVTRKKYGIRLRERRSRAEIEAERAALMGTRTMADVQSSAKVSVKRTRADEQEHASPQNALDTPRKRAPLAERGGLAQSTGSVETQDPTAYLTLSQPRGFAQLQQSQADAKGTQDDPMSIDCESESQTKD